MNKIELLIPVGDFDCLKVAIQNGANAVYLGMSEFNARYGAPNFTFDSLKQAIDYAHLRNVKVHLALNILIKNNEFKEAIQIAKKAYECGIDAIIVQDLGLAKFLINHFPDLPLHASTQMTCHNLSSAKYLEQLGFKRIVLARELSLSEIKNIKSHLSAEVEVFAHGALCISYSGQCLYSSLIGGRSGNRGKCAQGCRLPYELLEEEKSINKGYLLSPKDLCSLEILPSLLATGIDSLKIEGRMKSFEYVATVTKIYRKYIDKILNNEDYLVDKQDLHDLLQVFNRGNFSTGHLEEKPNHHFIFKEKPNHMGIYLGQVARYHDRKGHVTFHTNDTVEIGDSISFEKENTKYTISELMQDGKNVKQINQDKKIEIGRMKGNITVGDKIYKLSSKSLSNLATQALVSENIKFPLNAVLEVHLGKPIQLHVFDDTGLQLTITSSEIPESAIQSPITVERLKQQLNKTNNTPFYFKDIQINLDSNLYILHIRSINELRRMAIEKYSKLICGSYRKTANLTNVKIPQQEFDHFPKNISVLLNILHKNFDYSKLEQINKLYIPFKYFYYDEYKTVLKTLTNKFNTYIYLPPITSPHNESIVKKWIHRNLNEYPLKGFVASNLGHLEFLKEYKNQYEIISNYTMNVFNNASINVLNTSIVTLSPELNLQEINQIASYTSKEIELIVYGNLPLMTTHYCLLGNSNRCYAECLQKCKNQKKYYLKDRINFQFRIIPDAFQTITTIYNSKITSIDTHHLKIDSLRIDILDETVEQINHIIEVVKSGNRLEGKEYTNGNLNRIV